MSSLEGRALRPPEAAISASKSLDLGRIIFSKQKSYANSMTLGGKIDSMQIRNQGRRQARESSKDLK
jgi:hypothetical protein